MFKRRGHDKKQRSANTPRPSGAGSRSDLNLEDYVVEEIELTAPRAAGASSSRPMRATWHAFRLATGAFFLLVLVWAAALATRSAWPTDETRFLAIAWEMWLSHDWLIPHLNGAPAGVAPLFFWLINAGWQLFGVVEWWPRLLPALFLFGSLLLAARMSRFLWPSAGNHVRYSVFALLGSFYWVVNATFLSMAPLSVFFTLAALTVLLWMWRTRDMRVWLLLGPVLGLGLLAVGSILFFYILPVALLAPFWTRGTPTMPWRYWYADIFKASVVALALYSAWALPAAAQGGLVNVLNPLLAPIEIHALDFFSGTQPWWWYLFLLPWITFPWALWPLPWLRLWHIRRMPINSGLAFCMIWAVMTVLLFSCFESKQAQFLLPVVPAFFLVGIWLLLDEEHTTHDHSRLASTMIFPLLFLGGLLAVLPGLPRVAALPEFLWQLSPFVGVGVIALGVAIGWLPLPRLEARVVNMAVTVVVLSCLTILIANWKLNDRYDVSGAARVLANAQEQGLPIAHLGTYRGQYQFAGRLKQPLAELRPAQLELWLAANPQGLVVTYQDAWQPQTTSATPVYEQAYGRTQLRIWPTAALIPVAPGT